MADQWFYVENGQQRGPVSAQELARVIQSRTAGVDPLVWRAGMAEWIPFSKVNPTSDPSPQSQSSQSASTSPSSASVDPQLHTVPTPQPLQVSQVVHPTIYPHAQGETLTYFTPTVDPVKLGQAKTSMVLGIIAVSVIPFYCCSIFGLIAMLGSLVCGIIAVVMARKAHDTPGLSSRTTTGKVCGILGIVAAVIYVVFVVFVVIMAVSASRSFPTPTTFPTTNPTFVPPPTTPTSVPSNYVFPGTP